MAKAPPGLHEMHSIKIDNISYTTSVEQLRKAFDRFGDIGNNKH